MGLIGAHCSPFGMPACWLGRKAKGGSLEVQSEVTELKVRLHQFLSKTGHFSSKREAKDAVWSGEITVNGSVVKDISYQFNPRTRAVEYQGRRLFLPDSDITFVLNKPSGYLCARINENERAIGKRSVFDLFEGHVDATVHARLLTVGRLDEATTGLLIVTTSGDLVHRVTAPEHHVAKRYWVSSKRPLSQEAEQQLVEGVSIELESEGAISYYLTQPSKLERVNDRDFILEVVEGKKRQVRRMVAAVGNAVEHLHRLSIANADIEDFDLDEGAMREVKPSEIEAWFQQA